MTDKKQIREEDGWLIDQHGNRNNIEYWGDRAAAEKALLSLVGCSYCSDCTNCTNCSYCSGCSRCTDCSDCSGCSRCSYCSDCSDCSGCSRCSRCSYCMNRTDRSDCSDCSTNELAPTIPAIPDIHKVIYEAVSQPDALKMYGAWHTCNTTHCRGGWVVEKAGEAGKALEEFHNTELAAMLIYKASGYEINPARFYDSNEDAMEDMRRLAEGES